MIGRPEARCGAPFYQYRCLLRHCCKSLRIGADLSSIYLGCISEQQGSTIIPTSLLTRISPTSPSYSNQYLVIPSISDNEQEKMSQILSHNNNSFNTTNINYTGTDDRFGILGWLSPLDPLVRHQDIQTQRVDRVGDWLLRTKEFASWYGGCGSDGSGRAVLFCYGHPGVGKSHLT